MAVTVLGPLKLGDPAVIVHGGAGGWRGVSSFGEVSAAVKKGAEAGLATAERGALEAVVEAIAALEDSGVLNAGVGSVLTIDKRVEMDAGVMDSSRAGGIAVVTYPRNPVRLAYWVAVNTPHVIIAGPAADRLAEKLGLPRHPGPSERALRLWERLMERIRTGDEALPERILSIARLYFGDTVGAAVLVSGKLAAGTSTGGTAMKHPGRVGDSPIPGCGFYVEPGVGACAATGIGETIILGRPCLYALDLMRKDVPVAEAAAAAVARHTRLYGADTLGLVVLSVSGEAAAAMNTEAMPVGYAGSLAEPVGLVLRRGRAEK